MTPKQLRFADEYVLGLHAGNATKSAIAAGYSAKTAYQKGHQLANDPEVQARIAELRADQSRRLEISADMVLRRRWAIATADANELIEHRRVNCRYCWGKGHQYQWTAAEFAEAKQRFEEVKGRKTRLRAPEPLGGVGFDATRDPNPRCPECRGDGVERIHIHDSRKLAGAARLLYRGIKKGRDGIEVLMADQDKALDAVARQLGFDAVKDPADADETPPTPVQIVLNVKDARKTDGGDA